MNYEERKPLFARIEELRKGRTLLCFFNFDRPSEPQLPGLATVFSSDVKEAVFRVLKESPGRGGIDLCLYTRGGDTNAVWPLVSLIREFDPDFEVLVPFRCHSSGTLAALGAKRIVLGPLSELSPIDPTTGNAFNPRDPDSKGRLGISVEDVSAYREFLVTQLLPESKLEPELMSSVLSPFMQRLATDVHPLALGNVHRVLKQARQLARELLGLHAIEDEPVEDIVDKLTTFFYSHLHMINRHEAKRILSERIEFADDALAAALDELLRAYEDTFSLRQTYYLASRLQGKQEDTVRFAGAVTETRHWSYLFETKGVVRRLTRLPPNVQVQLPPGQPMPVIPGLPWDPQFEIWSQGWIHNTKPFGVTT